MSDRRIKDCRRPEFWRELCPGLTVSDGSHDRPPAASDVPLAAAEHMRADLAHDGYIVVPEVIESRSCAKLADCVRQVVGAGFPAPFALIYDEFWDLQVRAGPILQAVLGQGPLMIPDIWIWCVDGAYETQGWRPHRDTIEPTSRADGMPETITMWIPLVDVGPANSCIYLLPKFADPDYPAVVPESALTSAALAHVRALAATAGSVLCWDVNVLHWGSAYTLDAQTPRINISFYFQRADAEQFGLQALPLDSHFSLEDRLCVIGYNLQKYERFGYDYDEFTSKFARQFGSFYHMIHDPSARRKNQGGTS